MRRIDALSLEYPFSGSRQMARHLRRDGVSVGRCRVRRLMRLMDLEAIYRRAGYERCPAGSRHLRVPAGVAAGTGCRRPCHPVLRPSSVARRRPDVGDGRCQHVAPAVGPSPQQYDDGGHDGRRQDVGPRHRTPPGGVRPRLSLPNVNIMGRPRRIVLAAGEKSARGP